MYRGGRPGRLARALNRVDAWVYSFGVVLPDRAATLEVIGRRTGRLVSVPLVVVRHDGERYLVAMLGANTAWVRNVRAAEGRAVLRHGRRGAAAYEATATSGISGSSPSAPAVFSIGATRSCSPRPSAS